MAGEVLVKFRRNLASHERIQFDQDTEADRNDGIGGTGVRRIHSRRHDTAKLLALLQPHPDVEHVEPNYIVEADAIPNDAFFGWLWGLRNTGQTVGSVAGRPGADIGATLAWDVSTGSPTTVVAVTDPGIDYTHPDLAANVWSSPIPFSVTIANDTDVASDSLTAVMAESHSASVPDRPGAPDPMLARPLVFRRGSSRQVVS